MGMLNECGGGGAGGWVIGDYMHRSFHFVFGIRGSTFFRLLDCACGVLYV